MQHRRQKGKGFMSFMKKVGGFLKKTKLLSRVGSALGAIGVPYARTIGSAAGMLGYGRHRVCPIAVLVVVLWASLVVLFAWRVRLGGCTHVACIRYVPCILSQ